TRPHSIDKSINSDTCILSTLLIRPPGRIPHPKKICRRVYSRLPISPRYSSDEVSRLGIPRCILKNITLTLGRSCLRNNARNSIH
ncbi:hypothetical protein LINPERHAP1_LOCUS40962, partial [Linum perenne]